MVIQPELTLRFAHENNSDYLTCPVAPLQHDSQGNWARDEAFLPPLLTLQGIRWLVTQLGQLMTQLRARLGRLMAMRRESNERISGSATLWYGGDLVGNARERDFNLWVNGFYVNDFFFDTEYISYNRNISCIFLTSSFLLENVFRYSP